MPTIVAIDFETANRDAHSACQLGLVRLEDWKVADSRSWLIRPSSDLFEFTHIHGLTWEHVSEEPTWGSLWPMLAPHFAGADFLAAHNAPFDRGVLNASCEYYGHSAPKIPFIDSVQVARRVWNIFPTKLNNVCSHLQIALNHHEALSDANACAEILLRAAKQGWSPSLS